MREGIRFMTKSDVIGWTLVAISFVGGTYICWVFGHALARPFAHFIASTFF